MQILMNATMLRDPFDTRIRDVIVPAAVRLGFVAAFLWNSGPEHSCRWSRAGAAALIAVITGAATTVGAVDERLRHGGISRGLAGIAARVSALRAEFAPLRQRTGHLPSRYWAAVDYLRSYAPEHGRA